MLRKPDTARLEKETADAQAAHVKVWTAARDASRAEWLRLSRAGADRSAQNLFPSPEALAIPGTDWKVPPRG